MRWLGDKLKQIRDLDGGPRRIAVGIGIGTFINFLPPLGPKTPLSWSNLIHLEAPLLIGGTIIGIPLGITGCFVTLRFLRPPPGNTPPAPCGSSPPA